MNKPFLRVVRFAGLLLLCISLLTAHIPLIPVAHAAEPTGRLNGLTVVLDTISGSITYNQIISFMQTYHYNALKLYTGWCNSYWGVAYTGNPDDPIGSTAKTRISNLIQAAAGQGWYVICTISDQVSPAKTNDTWHDAEVQVGWDGPNSDLNSQDNWLDYTGPTFIRHQTALVETFVTLMEPYCTPRVGLEEMQYVSGGGHPAFYAQSMKDAYYADTGLSVPYFASTSTGWSGWSTEQRNFILYVNATIRGFYETMYEAAIAVNASTRFHAMTDDLVYYQSASPYIYYTQPVDYFGNTTVFEATEIECYGAVGGSIWTRVQACLDLCESWNPSADHFLTYGWYSSASAGEIQTAVTMAMDDGFRGVWAYGYNSGGSAFRTNPLDVSAYIPTMNYATVEHNATQVSTPCKFSSYWTGDDLAGYVFSYNGTGSWVNDTYTSLGGVAASWINVTKTLPAAVCLVGYKWYVNDTNGFWEVTPTDFFFTTTSGGENTVILGQPQPGASTSTATVTFTYTPTFFQAIHNATLWMYVSPVFNPVASNSSVVVNATSNSITYTFDEPGTYYWTVGVMNATHTVIPEELYTLIVKLESMFSSADLANDNLNYAIAEYPYFIASNGTITAFHWDATLRIFTFTVNASTGHSLTVLYVGERAAPILADNADDTYNATTMRLSLLVTHASSVIVTLDWGATAIGVQGFAEDSSLGFMADVNQSVLLTVTSGTLAGYAVTVNAERTRGTFVVTATSDASIDFTIQAFTVSVRGDRGNDWRSVGDGGNIVIDTGDTVTIRWYLVPEDWLSPFIMPMLGLSGFGLMAAGVVYVGQKIRDREWFEAIKGTLLAFTLIIIGAGLIIGWLW